MNAYADVFEDGRIKLSGNFLAFGHKSLRHGRGLGELGGGDGGVERGASG